MTKRDECRNCQFSLFDASSGQCKVCDYIQTKQRNRPCAACTKSNCHIFCDTCGSGYHKKCAEKNNVQVTPLEENEVSVVCPSCEKDEGGSEICCGGCHKEFSNEDAGLQVNQLVLVEFDLILYNAVVTEVNEAETSVKIHFVKWSKSFDGWYKMDDERVNESLACDGCNKWFHISCLPPIRSSGRFKAASYVCETCFKDAKSSRGKGKSSSSNSTSAPASKTKERLRLRRGKSENESNDEDENDADEESEEEEAIVLSPSTLVSLPEVPKRKVGRPSHKQLEAERLAKAKREAMLKTLKENSLHASSAAKSSSPRFQVAKRPSIEKEKVKNDAKEAEPTTKATKVSRHRESSKSANEKEKISPPLPPQNPPSPKRKSPAERQPPPPAPTSSPKQRKSKPKPSPKLAPVKSPSPVATDEDSSSEEEVRPVKKKLRDNKTETDLPLVKQIMPLQRVHNPQKPSNANSLILLSSLLNNSPRFDKTNQENCPPRNVTPFDILQVVANHESIPAPPPPSSPPPPLPPGPAPPATPAVVHGPESSFEYDMHFYLRAEMYRYICDMENDGHLPRDTATVLRAWTHPTSPRFQDMRFVFLVNKHMERPLLAQRLSEITRKYHTNEAPPPPPAQKQFSNNIV